MSYEKMYQKWLKKSAAQRLKDIDESIDFILTAAAPNDPTDAGAWQNQWDKMPYLKLCLDEHYLERDKALAEEQGE